MLPGTGTHPADAEGIYTCLCLHLVHWSLCTLQVGILCVHVDSMNFRECCHLVLDNDYDDNIASIPDYQYINIVNVTIIIVSLQSEHLGSLMQLTCASNSL